MHSLHAVLLKRICHSDCSQAFFKPAVHAVASPTMQLHLVVSHLAQPFVRCEFDHRPYPEPEGLQHNVICIVSSCTRGGIDCRCNIINQLSAPHDPFEDPFLAIASTAMCLNTEFRNPYPKHYFMIKTLIRGSLQPDLGKPAKSHAVCAVLCFAAVAAAAAAIPFPSLP